MTSTPTTDPGSDVVEDLARGATLLGGPDQVLAAEQVEAFVREQLAAAPLDGRSVCVVVPDGTRSCPLPLLLNAVHGALSGRVTRLTVLVALGTHAAMDEERLRRHVGGGTEPLETAYPGMTVRNHEWWDPDTFVTVGTIPADRVGELSEGRLHRSVDVRVNRAVVDHDVALVVGPVSPHEVVGFSGGNKYFFPGVSGQEVIDLSHWLGALITSVRRSSAAGESPRSGR
jgi:nickel-dependent lactate racemase